MTWTPDRWVVVEEGHFVDENVLSVRLEPARVTTVWANVTPIVDVHAGAHFHIGPAASHWSGRVATVSIGRPAAGAMRARAKAVAVKMSGHVVTPRPRGAAVKASVNVNVNVNASTAVHTPDAKAEVKGAAAVKGAPPAKKAPPPAKKAPPPAKKHK